MLVVQGLPQDPQLPKLFDVSTQAPLHRVGVLAGQPDVHAYPAPAGAQRGVPPEHATPQPPQVFTCVRSVSHPSAALPLQSAQSLAQAEGANEHWPAPQAVVPLTCGKLEQSFAHVPQWCTPLGTHPPSHARFPGREHVPPSDPPSLSPPLTVASTVPPPTNVASTTASPPSARSRPLPTVASTSASSTIESLPPPSTVASPRPSTAALPSPPASPVSAGAALSGGKMTGVSSRSLPASTAAPGAGCVASVKSGPLHPRGTRAAKRTATTWARSEGRGRRFIGFALGCDGTHGRRMWHRLNALLLSPIGTARWKLRPASLVHPPSCVVASASVACRALNPCLQSE